MTCLLQEEVMSSCGGEQLARRRLQQKGDLFDQGGMWKLRWHEDKITPGGELTRGWSRAVHLGPSDGVGKLTEKEARRLGWENFLSKIDAGVCAPHSAVTIGNFVDQRFLPDHVALLKRSGRSHYESMLKHVLPTLRNFRLKDITAAHIQKLVSSMLLKNYSVQTVKHVRTVVSAIFTHAKRLGWHTGDNPAKLVRLPEMIRREAHALSFKQAVETLAALKTPVREMVLFAIVTSMNIAEVCGLQWKRVNLSEQFATVDGESLPPLTIAVRAQWYRGEYGSVKAKSRRRNVPIPELLRAVLASMKERPKFTGLDDPVFAARSGKPVDEHNIARRHLKPVGRSLGMPWLSWHCFRRTHTTLAHELGMVFTDRMAMMGHSEARMTALYTADDLKRRRTVLDQMAERLLPASSESPSFLDVACQSSADQETIKGARKSNGQNGR
jgi:integrase